ncbi:dnaJ homolog subfamily C member 4-like [Ischnura elegans]|uniref:dnaJ homolog subfamily C member 4-like n=1 Tax=Ischnura elegans TaxID=197161 RepID=UPI001ED8B5B3|nr:dnaJ homolog subfamily C member 4-like [Ischnura elegans]
MYKLKRLCWRSEHVELYFNALRSIRSSGTRLSSKNHYEILQVKRDCTAKEVRDAFIKLSKEMHPDKNRNDPLNHQRFVKLNEAYSVLSRPQKRSAYDLTLRNEQYIHRTNSTPTKPTTTVYTDPYEYYNLRRPGQDGQREDGKEHQRMSKSWIVFLCIIFASAGVGLQVLAIRESLTFSRERLDKVSEENSRILADVRRRASENGFEKQLKIMRKKIEDSVEEYNQSKKGPK